MFRFILFLGFLVGIAYVLTEPPQSQLALGANEIPVHNDKPLLTSWGPTLGSLRDGVREQPHAVETTMVASNEPSDVYEGQSFGASEIVVAAANPETDTTAADLEPVTVASVQRTPQPVAAEQVDRVAAALPPQRRGLFSRALAPQAAQATREAAPRNGGLFKRLLGRGKQPTRAWALGPAR